MVVVSQLYMGPSFVDEVVAGEASPNLLTFLASLGLWDEVMLICKDLIVATKNARVVDWSVFAHLTNQ